MYVDTWSICGKRKDGYFWMCYGIKDLAKASEIADQMAAVEHVTSVTITHTQKTTPKSRKWIRQTFTPNELLRAYIKERTNTAA